MLFVGYEGTKREERRGVMAMGRVEREGKGRKGERRRKKKGEGRQEGRNDRSDRYHF